MEWSRTALLRPWPNAALRRIGPRNEPKRPKTLLGWLAPALVLAAAYPPSHGAAPPTELGRESAVAIYAISDAGRPVPVDGIVCDNLRETPGEEKDCLLIRLPAAFRGASVSGAAANPDGTTVDVDGSQNAGSVFSGRGAVIYYPPAEYNRRQEPRGPRDIDGPATRIVLLTLHARSSDGEVRDFAPVKIVLARPPVVLVHGINRGPDCWSPLIRSAVRSKCAEGKRLEFPFAAVDHFRPANYDGVDFRDRRRFPEGLFFGSGPVEIGASLLAREIEEVRRSVSAGERLPSCTSIRGTGQDTFRYRNPAEPEARLRLAIRRVDVIGWSYGGVIARWYLAGGCPNVPRDALRYRGTYTLQGPDGRTLDMTPKVAYGNDIRKLITLGSMWRGVPLVNYLNEIRFSKQDGPDSLRQAPIRIPRWMPRSAWARTGGGRTVGSLADAIDAQIRVKSPAMEVMAVDSPWMSALDYGRADPEGVRRAAPFRADVAYGSVAGDNSAFLSFGRYTSICPYGALLYFQQPPRFPYLALERRAGVAGALSPIIGDKGDYSDGVVPLWSAEIPGKEPGAARVVHASHDRFFSNADTLHYLARWLNNASLPTGSVLNSEWSTPIASPDGRKQWEWRRGEMAPAGRAGLYGCIAGIGRILPAALHPDRSLSVYRESADKVRVDWDGPAGGRLHRVALYEGPLPEAGEGTKRAKPLDLAVAQRDAEQPYAEFDRLRGDRPYFVVAEAEVENAPDPPVVIKSRPARVPGAESVTTARASRARPY